VIDGVVFMPSPLGYAHGRASVPVLVWLSYYQENTPGVEVLDNATSILGPKSEPQPDAQLRTLPECGGQTRDAEGFVAGAPELVVEVAKATRYIDLGPKLDDYERAGVREYVVRTLVPDEVLCTSCRRAAWWRCLRTKTGCTARGPSRVCGSTRRR
jgi:Uma2 family endonuclease